MEMKIYGEQNPENITENQRFIGKTAVLGCGYQMGAPKFKATVEGYGVEISEALAAAAVKAYRQTYKEVVDFWYEIERAAIHAIRTRDAHTINCVTFYIAGDFLYCRLPSTRLLAYHKPTVKRVPFFDNMKDTVHFMGVNSTTNQYEEQRIYGGKFTENIVQGIARDLLAEAMLRCEKAGYPVVMHVHDEIVVEVDNDRPEFSIVVFNDIITDLPGWAKSCPIEAEGWRGKRYRK